MADRAWGRSLGFLLLMVGTGLRLDTAWQGAAWIVLAIGGLLAGMGVADLRRSAFVPPDRQG